MESRRIMRLVKVTFLTAAVQRSTQGLSCPEDWSSLNAADERERCYGVDGRASFFGNGMVDAEAAASH
jgi:hypothetical protein